MSERIEALVKSHMLVWARDKSGFDINSAAKRLHINPEQLKAWESGEKRPTINQALGLAELYKRPLSLFYLNEPPRDFTVANTDFRRLPDSDTPMQSPGLLLELRIATMRRQAMLDLSEEVGSGEFVHLNSISLSTEPEDTAQQIRDVLEIDWSTQQKWRDQYDALSGWRLAIERLNVLVFHTSHQGSTFLPSEARGISISEQRFPVIVVNGTDAPRARIFTLLHEFVHLLLNNGGFCNFREYFGVKTIEQQVEVFCNHVAGATLVPSSLLLAHKVVRRHTDGGSWTDYELQVLATEFNTSQEVIARRLLTLGLASQQFYEKKRQYLEEAWREYRQRKKEEGRKGAPPHYRMMMRKHGKPFVRTVFSAYYGDQLTLSDVCDYLGVKVKYLKDMEREAFAASYGEA